MACQVVLDSGGGGFVFAEEQQVTAAAGTEPLDRAKIVADAVDVEVAGDDDDLGRMGEYGGEELGACVAKNGDLVGRLLVGNGAEEEEVGEDAGGGLETHAVEDVAAAGDGVDALDAAGEGWAAEGVEVLLE